MGPSRRSPGNRPGRASGWSAYAQADRVAEALALLERALTEARSINLQHGHSLLLAQFGRACLVAGRLADADRLAAEALTLARQRGERGDEAWALLLHGEVAAAREPADLDGARAWYARALALGGELGMRPLAARCRLMLGAAELMAGRADEARRWLQPAIEELRAMGIAAWLARAEVLLAVPPDHGAAPMR